MAPRSNSACSDCGPNACPVRSWIRADVRVDREHGLAEGLVADRAGGVGPDPRQLGQVVGPAVLGDVPRGPMQVERAPVVAEPLPLPDHVGGRRGRERSRRRPPLEPGEVARHDALDLRLLEHHLGDEDRVRIARPPPRQVATGSAEPRQQQLVHGHRA